MDIIAVIISVVSLVVSILQFYFERNRNRCEATIHAFDKLQEDVFDQEIKRNGTKFKFKDFAKRNQKVFWWKLLQTMRITKTVVCGHG